MPTSTDIERLTAVSVSPDDIVVIHVSRQMTHGQAAELMQEWRDETGMRNVVVVLDSVLRPEALADAR